MTNSRARGGLSALTLRFSVLDNPDRPTVEILVDGEDPFATVVTDWRGFDPAQMLGTASPLIPPDLGLGRRVAVHMCSCGIAGCGVIAPVIVPSPDGSRISWVDFRDYVGVFVEPVFEFVSKHEGRSWDLPDLHFDRDQYLAEVDRAARDDSWEPPLRRTARLLETRLRTMNLVPPLDWRLRRVSPVRDPDGVEVAFARAGDGGPWLFRLTSSRTDPDAAAEDLAGQVAVGLERWLA